jgi:hypothetical protein
VDTGAGRASCAYRPSAERVCPVNNFDIVSPEPCPWNPAVNWRPDLTAYKRRFQFWLGNDGQKNCGMDSRSTSSLTLSTRVSSALERPHPLRVEGFRSIEVVMQIRFRKPEIGSDPLQDFRRVLAEIKAEMFPDWSDEALIVTRDEAAEYCQAVRKKLGAPRLTRPFILTALIGVRKARTRRTART